MSDVCHTNATPAKNAAFPLTPALSPGERESRIQFLDKPEHLGLANRLTKVLPLPKGAGRGEGKRRFRRACSVAFARPPCEGRSICVLLRLVRERIIWFSSLFVCFTTAAFAAEPTVDPKDLPRIPPTAPDKALSTFRIKSGFRLELVAAEPLVVDPIAMSFDENGRLFVVEMRDYSERRDERLGRIRLLEDTDGDGRFDKSTVYLDHLPWPTAVICYNGGIFVGATPDILYCKDTNGDGVADVKEVVFTGFASDYAPYQTNRLNVQAMLNSFNWGLDNRIHGATSMSGGKVVSAKHPEAPALELRGRDFSFDPRDLTLRAESGGGQHGLSFDNRGRKFVCSNSSHIQMLMYEERYAARNPYFPLPSALVGIAVDGPAAEVYRLSPDEPWRVIRTQWRVSGLVPGPVEGGGRPSGYFTGATGVTIYRGNAFPEEFLGDAFVADCGSNLVHRKKLRPANPVPLPSLTPGERDRVRGHGSWKEGMPASVELKAERPADEQKVEFLASTDNWFRPVQFANAPDGCLYVLDMYREIIEHPWSLPPGIKKHLDLNAGNDRGRIYRIVPEKFRRRPAVRLGDASPAELVKTLEHPNGWHRDTAARLLYERQDKSVVPQLRKLSEDSRSEFGRFHAFYALAGLGELNGTDVNHGLIDSSPA
ncbi:MAG TPA: PVC-type heme-binding CxxCH protein, partial [Candidatus Eisenbacteria bacterium]|nr:PVC-type heme-binding CxxCH protein [Candidatus Eisenbacteria bacterium]